MSGWLVVSHAYVTTVSPGICPNVSPHVESRRFTFYMSLESVVKTLIVKTVVQNKMSDRWKNRCGLLVNASVTFLSSLTSDGLISVYFVLTASN